MIVHPKVPTRSRVSIIHRLPYYSPGLMCSLGIVQLVSGIALVSLSLLMFRLDRDKALSWSISFHYLDPFLPEVLRIIWLGAWIATSGLITLIGTFRPSSGLHQLVILLSAVVTIAITGAFAILISNHVIQHSLISSLLQREPPPLSVLHSGENPLRSSHSHFLAEEHLSRPVYFTVFMLCLCLFCTVSFVISIIIFSVVSHHLCSCPSPFNNKSHYQIYTWSKKERIVQWVMQQSQLTDPPDLATINRPEMMMVLTDGDLVQGRKKLSALQSSATNSTQVSLYEAE